LIVENFVNLLFGFRGVKGLGFRVWGSRFRVQHLGYVVEGLWFGVWGLACGVQALGLRVYGLRLRV
jgi:hypothetical protein